jgi:hypothetical protein
MDPTPVAELPPEALPPETRCYRCNYDLHTLDPASNCPECGEPISRTLNFGLEHADGDWLRRQARTMFLLMALPVVQYADADYIRYRRYVGFPITLGLLAVAAWACWRLSSPEPERDRSDNQSILARGVRVCSLALVVLVAIAQLSYRRYPAPPIFLYGVLGSLVTLCWLAPTLVMHLARRAGRSSLTTHARLIVWALPIAAIIRHVVPLLPIGFPYEPGVGQVLYAVVTWVGSFAVFAAVALFARMHEVLRLIADGVPVAPKHP